MEKIEIELYKGQTIYYSESLDKFTCEIELSDNVKNAKRPSLKDLKKEIDKFIAVNVDFKPFTFYKYEDWRHSFVKAKCVALRSDGKFVIEDQNGYKNIIDFKEMEEIANVYDPEIEKVIIAANEETQKARDNELEVFKNSFKKLKRLDLTNYKI